ncbi:MAG TPA: glycosyltransferase family protein [Solirubrobacteraceae bacterium]|nr:glycosyltransferase family protein [Solirubrobacteraceae bacterium]
MEVLGRPLLGYQIERVQRAARVEHVCVATTTNSSDDSIVSYCAEIGVDVFRGSEDDVLGRFRTCAAERSASIVVRLTADCPLVDPALVDTVVDELLRPPACDYVSNALDRTFPVGLDCEAMTFAALEAADTNATDPREREHVTPYIYTRPGEFDIRRVRCPKQLSQHRWTVDTRADFQLVERIISSLYPENRTFGWEDVLDLVDANPGWGQANAMVPHRQWDTDPD